MTIDYFVNSQKVREDIGAMRLSLNFLRLYINIDDLVKSYVMPLCGTVTENNLPIISKGYG